MFTRIAVVALAVLTFFGQRTRADYIYTFTTTETAGDGGSLSVRLFASDGAVATGMLSQHDLFIMTLDLTGTAPPFFDVTVHGLGMTFDTPIQVDPATGAFVTLPRVEFTAGAARPLEYIVVMPLLLSDGKTPYTVTDLLSDRTEEGRGVWTVTHTAPSPTPSSLVLAGVAGGCILLAGVVRRRYGRLDAPPATT
jgi:hypothetical protein